MPEGLKSFSPSLFGSFTFSSMRSVSWKTKLFLFKRISRFALACFACTLSPVVQLSMILRGFPRSTSRFSRDLVIIAHLKAFVNSFSKTFLSFFRADLLLFACSVSIPYYFLVVKRVLRIFLIFLQLYWKTSKNCRLLTFGWAKCSQGNAVQRYFAAKTRVADGFFRSTTVQTRKNMI